MAQVTFAVPNIDFSDHFQTFRHRDDHDVSFFIGLYRLRCKAKCRGMTYDDAVDKCPVANTAVLPSLKAADPDLPSLRYCQMVDQI